MKYVIVLKTESMDNILIGGNIYSTSQKAYKAIKDLPEANLDWWKLDKKHKKLVNKEQSLEYYINELKEVY